MTEVSKSGNAETRELIAFRIGTQEFCIDIMSIREIRGWTPATPLPKSPSFVRGVINLRGTVLPIVDLAVRLGFAPSEPTARHAIMVSQIGQQVVGLLVEGVSDIFTVSDSDIQPTPDVASDMAKRFVRGVIATDGRMISLIALNAVLPSLEMEAA
ncbi:MAG: chemotaxis protein CheW [Hyphomicrobiales bacterium]|jgi:purine-binding chemotaxis protein CheW|nr:MAG: chemotaxis protein CheW [Hyphomicrobiales bacterium]